jgi:glucose/arabinose dehydrogenase
MRLPQLAMILGVASSGLLAGCVQDAAPAGGAAQPPVVLQIMADGFTAPLGLRSPADGSGRLFVLEQGGAIRIVPRGAARADDTPFLAFAGEGGAAPPYGFTTGGERGLLGLAFHPDYARNRTFFLDYTDAHGDTVVARYRARSDEPSRADPDSAEVVLRVDQDYSNHNGGDLAFGPDGFLYIALGDGGNGGDPCSHGQTLAPAALENTDVHGHCVADREFAGPDANPDSRALLAKLLRIDVDHATAPGENTLCAAHADGSAAYAIPADNPYARADAEPAGACAETWAYGLRNPWRIAFDRATGDLFIGDVGQNRVEEIDFQPARNGGGRNYGWNRCEGDQPYGNTGVLRMGSDCPVPDSAATPRPILSYAHQNGDCSVTGGYRYRGPVSALAGAYVYGDYCTGRVWFARQQGPKWTTTPWQRVGANISSFGEDQDGNLYLVDYAGGARGKGNVRRFAAAQ